MHTRSKLLVIAAIACAATAPDLRAQEITSPYRHIETTHSVGAFAGYLWTDRGPADLEIGPHSAPLLGMRYNLHFGGPAYGEVALAFSPTRRDIFRREGTAEEGAAVPTGTSVRTTLMVLDAGVRFNFTGPRTWHGLAPFAVATGGLVTDLTRGSATEEAMELPADQRYRVGPALAVAAGLGTDWFLSERLSLRVEARNQIWRMTTPHGFDPVAGSRTTWRNSPLLSVGGALHF